MGYDITYAAAGADTDKSWYHEAVIQDVLAYARSTGTVKTDAGQIGRVRRQEKVAVAGRDKGQDDHRINTYPQSHRHHNSYCRCLRIYQLGGKERDECIGPWIIRYRISEYLLQNGHVIGKIRICHPGNTINGYERYHTGSEYRAVADILCLYLAAHEHDSRHEEHDHLNHDRHGYGLHLAAGLSEMRNKAGIAAEDGNGCNAKE